MRPTPGKQTKNRQQRGSLPLSTRLNRFGFQAFGNLLPRLMSWWALNLWSRTCRFASPAREQRMRLRGSECSLMVNGQQVKAWKWGTGPSVLLVHGWNGRGLQLGRFIDPLLNAGYQVIGFDAPGHGQTGGKRTHLLAIRDVITALSKQYGPFHAAIGHSFGVACLSAAIVTGMTVPTLIAISSPGGLSTLIGRYCRFMRIPPPTEQRLRQRLSKRLGAPLWRRFAESYPLDTGVERALVIHDKDDQLVGWQESERLSQCWPNAELLLTEGLGHRRILMDPSLAQKVTLFIDNGEFCDPLIE